jgi:predicted site-specific integrase-resolvase
MSIPIPSGPSRLRVYAKAIGLSVGTVRELARKGLIPAVRTPTGQWRVLPEAFTALQATRTG